METFLFTDIQSSTRLWEEHPQEMTEALGRHDEILAESIAGAGGHLIKTTGDGAIAVFDSPQAAVTAAQEAQGHLRVEDWGPTGTLQVRMGIHTGHTERRDGDYFGPEMNRAARIMAAGHGGQVLLSERTANLVRSPMPAAAGNLRDLGTHRLKDLTAPEHLYQLVTPGLEADFPALRTLDSRPNNLPLQATEFLGREDELNSISAMLESPSVRLLTIAGPGGAGKTRLGLQIAAEHSDSFTDGVFFVDLTAAREPDTAFEAIVQTLGFPTGGSDAISVLKSRLRDQQMLLVLDNFEQITAAAPGVADLLQSAPDLRIVVTSRETLRIRGEHVFTVPPMSLPNPKLTVAEIAQAESVQLFVERARSVRADFALDEENAAAVAEICLRLDGLPLAIELAAARLNIFSPHDLLDRLRDRLDVLGAGGRDLPDRQRTLWGAIGWSYELLEPNERKLFELLSVFSPSELTSIELVLDDVIPGGFDLDALASLVDKSLVRRSDSGSSHRFSMLLMIKEFASERLSESPTQEEAVRKAHAEHFFELAQRLQDDLNGERRADALEDFGLDIGNLRTAWAYWVERADLPRIVEFLAALWALHEARGWYRAAIEMARTTLAIIESSEKREDFLSEELTIRTGLARAMMAVEGYGPSVEAEFQTVLSMAENASDNRRIFPVLRALATYYIGITEFEKAAEVGWQLLELGQAERDERIEIEAHYVIGAGVTFAGDLEQGLPHLEKSIQLHDPAKHGSSRFRLGPNTGVVARVAYGMIAWMCGGLDRAVEHLEEGLVLARELDHPYSLAYALFHNGFMAINRYRFEDCARFADELAVVADENEYVVWSTLAAVLQGVSTAALGKPEEGLEMTEKGIHLYQGLTTPPVFWPLLLGLRSMVHAMAGNVQSAIDLAHEASQQAEGDDVMSALYLIFKGNYLAMLEVPDLPGSAKAYTKAIESAQASGLKLVELQARTQLVAINRRLELDPDGSEDLASLIGTFEEGQEEAPLIQAKGLLSQPT